MQKTKEYQYYRVLVKGYEEFVYRASSEVTSLQCIDEDGEWFSTRRTPEQFMLFVASQYAPDHKAYLSGPHTFDSMCRLLSDNKQHNTLQKLLRAVI